MRAEDLRELAAAVRAATPAELDFIDEAVGTVTLILRSGDLRRLVDYLERQAAGQPPAGAG